jgi:hypothetical protein
MIADARFDTGRFRAPADDAVGVLLEKGIGCKLAGLAAGGAEEIAVFNRISSLDREVLLVFLREAKKNRTRTASSNRSPRRCRLRGRFSSLAPAPARAAKWTSLLRG